MTVRMYTPNANNMVNPNTPMDFSEVPVKRTRFDEGSSQFTPSGYDQDHKRDLPAIKHKQHDKATSLPKTTGYILMQDYGPIRIQTSNVDMAKTDEANWGQRGEPAAMRSLSDVNRIIQKHHDVAWASIQGEVQKQAAILAVAAAGGPTPAHLEEALFKVFPAELPAGVPLLSSMMGLNIKALPTESHAYLHPYYILQRFKFASLGMDSRNDEGVVSGEDSGSQLIIEYTSDHYTPGQVIQITLRRESREKPLQFCPILTSNDSGLTYNVMGRLVPAHTFTVGMIQKRNVRLNSKLVYAGPTMKVSYHLLGDESRVAPNTKILMQARYGGGIMNPLGK